MQWWNYKQAKANENKKVYNIGSIMKLYTSLSSTNGKMPLIYTDLFTITVSNISWL